MSSAHYNGKFPVLTVEELWRYLIVFPFNDKNVTTFSFFLFTDDFGIIIVRTVKVACANPLSFSSVIRQCLGSQLYNGLFKLHGFAVVVVVVVFFLRKSYGNILWTVYLDKL